MIAANVAAAKAREMKKAPVMYRDHEPPSREKLVALKDYLKTYEVEFALGQVVRPQTFNHIIERVRAGAFPGESRGPGSTTDTLDPGLRRGAEEGESDILPQIMEQIHSPHTQAYHRPQNHEPTR